MVGTVGGDSIEAAIGSFDLRLPLAEARAAWLSLAGRVEGA